MPVVERIDWIASQFAMGRKGYITMGCALDATKFKVKVVLKAPQEGRLDSNVFFGLSATVQLLRHWALSCSVVDRGHKHSNGASTIAFWVSLVAPPEPAQIACAHDVSTAHENDSSSKVLNANAEEYCPAGSPSVAHASAMEIDGDEQTLGATLRSSVNLSGQWESLPSSGWNRVYKRFRYAEVTNALKSYCVFATSFSEKLPNLRELCSHCSGTSWGGDYLRLLNRFEASFAAIREIDHSHESLLRHHETILDVKDVAMECGKRLEDLVLLVSCYPKRWSKRYKFLRPADVSLCRFSDLDLADALLQLTGRDQEVWLARLHTCYALNHAWMTLDEIEQIDPLYLVRQLRPRFRLEIDVGVHNLLNG
eukprot:TRINITY_DN13795_c0_g2_i2.p1 TRINITY_DN13795_c0_g2~~TRINITY_DN13795_c0_g2_i2.p1  ORF type:complete len:367 (-),score=32.72 TRINITY_DN13795_c0_g2_i2:212-1312(-)